jgi:ubiquinone/menaquinone biosynthesis C-methylase UbiE
MDFEEKIGTTFSDYEGSSIYNHYHEKSHKSTIAKLMPESPNSKILDLGCAGGTYWHLIKSKNFKYIFGADLSLNRLLKAKEKGYITINCNAKSLPFELETFDCVICIDMLVHVLKRADRDKIFGEVHRVLKTNGLFIFSIPSLKAYILGDYGVDKSAIFSNPDGQINDYCSLISFEEIIFLADKYSFSVEKIKGTQYNLKLFRPIKRFLKEQSYYKYFLPFLDVTVGSTFFKSYGKAAFFKIKKL